MNKRLLLTIVIVVVVLVAIVVWKSTASSAAIQHTRSTVSPNASIQMSDDNIPHKNKDEIFQDSLLKQLKKFQQQPGNITQFLNDFKDNCPVSDCNSALAKALANYPDQKFAQLVANLLKRLPEYEQRMQSTVLSTALSPKERFDALWKLREQTLGQAETMLGFGQERQYADYRFAYNDLAQNQKLSAEQRLKAFEELQKQYPDTTQQENKIGQYEQALNLIKQGQQNPAEIERIKQKLQQQYLTEQERQEVQQRERREAQQQQQVDQYQQALQQLQQEMEPLKAQLSDTEWQKQYQSRLENLRLKMFP
ncbi:MULTISPECIES: lipase chaperone [unclassified Acinetobacter]|uniref:lipase chaperone n=1 Tax=unclassified Acinetobacter TaxID=196816 RepID=UPI001F4A3470|nr:MULTISPECIES: lipase chaperone [unclassified Acinetobacter]MCH7350370.1 lipase chaperone [Acinetobacter sp. NIPH 2023]MCH7357990.1 lipase chaperone [Acinetobacter sp. NIPH 2024]